MYPAVFTDGYSYTKLHWGGGKLMCLLCIDLLLTLNLDMIMQHFILPILFDEIKYL